ncbi:Phosphoribosylaminoimidazole carboxylase [Ramicandelaber brevisporus]|nr:Phosphoribosylaminoimidazole carboxylase [Ramicandelaber brevisporus]
MPLGRRVGVLGGGQLGRMLAEAGHRMGLPGLTIVDPLPKAPAKQLVGFPGGGETEHIDAAFTDPAAISKVTSETDVTTVEIEHVDCNSLDVALKSGKGGKIEPHPDTIRVIQDKWHQKHHLKSHNVPVADFVLVSGSVPDVILNSGEAFDSVAKSSEALEECTAKAGEILGYPFMLKARRGAYDGRGNAVIKSKDDIKSGLELLGRGEKTGGLYAEKWAKFTKELAVMVVRNSSGTDVRAYPVVETVQRNSVCHAVVAPAQIDGNVAKCAESISLDAIRTFLGGGIYGVELFLVPSESENSANEYKVIVNEIAPRPHNSGHYTIEACNTSQFENHLRAVLDIPLGDTSLKVPASCMINLLGASSNMNEMLEIVELSYTIPSATVHWYGKEESRKGRKMAHVTVTADSMIQLKDRCSPIFALIDKITGYPADTPSPIGATTKDLAPLVGVIMGSDSDLPTMLPAARILRDMDVPFELTVVSAHRTAERMMQYARSAHTRGLKVIIAAAGGAAHLPGMVASMTPLPVIGVPVKLKTLDGVDSLYSIVQMPRGVPVATVAINNSDNAALLAVRILGSSIPTYLDKMAAYQKKMEDEVLKKAAKLESVGWENYSSA